MKASFLPSFLPSLQYCVFCRLPFCAFHTQLGDRIVCEPSFIKTRWWEPLVLLSVLGPLV